MFIIRQKKLTAWFCFKLTSRWLCCGSWEMSQWVKSPFYNYEDVNSIQTQWCTPITPVQRRDRLMDPWEAPASQPSLLSESFRYHKQAGWYLRNGIHGCLLFSIPMWYMHTCAHAHTHIVLAHLNLWSFSTLLLSPFFYCYLSLHTK